VSININVTLQIHRKENKNSNSFIETHIVDSISSDASFLEMLDVLNEKLIENNKNPISFESDCREGICGACSLVINGVPHGKEKGITTCQLHMRTFNSGDIITIEPWKAAAFPIIKDLVVNRSALDKIMHSGGYISAKTGSARDGNSILISKQSAEKAFNGAACIGCGACVAACKNASAMLFVAAKISHLSNLPQGLIERKNRITNMIMQMDHEGFGSCTNTLECSAVCPKEISTSVINELNQEFISSIFSTSN